MILFSELAKVCSGEMVSFTEDHPVAILVIDSRKAVASPGSLFFALTGPRHNGHFFIGNLYAQGFRQFVVSEKIEFTKFPEANFLLVRSALEALQKLVEWHRHQFSIPIIGITGSNAKTIIKEWLWQLMSVDYNTAKNPGSYNSQTGVPLSVWQLNSHHELAIFEAGISEPGEMAKLQRMILPEIGIFTNIGPAHAEGFESESGKIREKLLLFSSSRVIIYCKDHLEVAGEIEKLHRPGQQLVSWGIHTGSSIKIVRTQPRRYSIQRQEQFFELDFPFGDNASIENAMHCVVALMSLGYAPETIQERISLLRTIPMRLELKQGINGCQLIDDTYNNDLSGLQISLDFLAGIQNKKSTLILSDILQSGLTGDSISDRIAELLETSSVNSLIGIGPVMCQYKDRLGRRLPFTAYVTTEDFLERLDIRHFQDEVILVKGARTFQFEKIVNRLQRKIHGTVMEIDLGAMIHNLNFFRARLNHGVKIMAMVKAFAYGSGSEEVAGLLQYHGINYLGVAYPDEGIDLRKKNIRLPIMVMNPTEESFSAMMEYALEPEIYNLRLLKSLVVFLKGKPCKVHVKIETGMHRLGFEENDFTEVIAILKANPAITVASVFSHLAGADESDHDAFTREQAERFVRIVSQLKSALTIDPLLHILNSAGILRFPEWQFSMVRLGIGLYGINPATVTDTQLLPVATLKSVISQIKTISPGDTVGYGRKGRAERELRIATIALGYADGFSRSFSQGTGEVLINGVYAPVIGNVCMDMTMIDITDVPGVSEGDEVIIFGRGLSIDALAKKINTIPYEILTSMSTRIKRVFFAESI